MLTIRTLLSITILLVMTLISALATAEQVVRYPQSGQIFKDHHAYPLELLKLALSKSSQNYQFKPSESFMIQGRAIKELESGRDINLLWTMTSKEREQTLHPIRIPIYKGLIGWRVFLTNQPEIIGSKSAIPLDRLKKLSLVQGHDWPDKKILLHNDFKVSSSPSFEGLFQMITLQRADLFPRSIIEVWDELEQRKDQGIKLEQHTVVSYPTASYFFTREDNQLAKDIYSGLMKAVDDGSFDQLFTKHFDKFIDQSNIQERKHYALENPLLTAETPLNNQKLWLSP